MPNLITLNLDALRGKSISDLCPQGFDDSEANHCAHFVSHAGDYRFGFLCHLLGGSNHRGVSVRVQEIFPNCPQVGRWADRPATEDDLLVFITARSNVNLANKTIQNVPKKHIGVLRGGHVYHYSNGEDKVVRQTPDDVRTRFRAAYHDQTVDLFFGTLPDVTRAARSLPRIRAAGRGLNLKLIRNTYTTTSTIGDLSVNGEFECYVLEDPVRPEKIAGITAIPAGIYSVVITRSPKFGRDLPLLESVPAFEGIRIHPGNTAVDTHGCLLPGRSKAADFVGDSRLAFGELFEQIRDAQTNGERIQIEIIEGGASPFMRTRATKRREAGGGLYRVLADPLRVRTTTDAEAGDNIAGALEFGLIVTATGAGASPGWIAVKTTDEDSVVSGFVPVSFLEPVPAPSARAARRQRSGRRTSRRSSRGPQPAAPAELFRVRSDSANLRSVAGVLDPANVIAALPRGHLVAKTGGSSVPVWWEVRTVLHGETLTGFMNAGLLVADIGGAGPLPLTESGPEVKVSERALEMILEFEGMDQPSKWPGEKSGISLGHGYDLGYHTRDEFMGDWGPFLTEDQIGRLAKAIGKTGTAAKNIADNFTGITIKRADADSVFMRGTLPKIKLWAAKSFHGVTGLPADAQGGLVSLVYNRGTDMEGDRRREMREVRDTVADASLSVSGKLGRIATSIRSMKRLWPDTLGLRRRRDAEAALVESAL